LKEKVLEKERIGLMKELKKELILVRKKAGG
jgi:hypothetical protein